MKALEDMFMKYAKNQENIEEAEREADAYILRQEWGNGAIGLKTTKHSVCLLFTGFLQYITAAIVDGTKYGAMLMQIGGGNVVFVEQINLLFVLVGNMAFFWDELSLEQAEFFLENESTTGAGQAITKLLTLRKTAENSITQISGSGKIIAYKGNLYQLKGLNDFKNVGNCGLGYFFGTPEGEVYIQHVTSGRSYRVLCDDRQTLEEMIQIMTAPSRVRACQFDKLGLWQINNNLLYHESTRRVYTLDLAYNLYVFEKDMSMHVTADCYNGVLYEEETYRRSLENLADETEPFGNKIEFQEIESIENVILQHLKKATSETVKN